jgi:hypothetical protein
MINYEARESHAGHSGSGSDRAGSATPRQLGCATGVRHDQ